jgi:sugar lactone lactonase YvrE/tetratricopeptide (TPR) repeat protein
MKKKLTTVFIFAYLAILLFGTFSVGASEAYDTFTYSKQGDILYSPAAYSANGRIDSQAMNLERSKADFIERYKLYSADAVGKTEEEVAKAAEAAAAPLNTLTSAKVNDIIADSDGNVYLADTGNNRIVVLDPTYKYLRSIDLFESTHSDYDSLKAPQGLFVTDDYIYVCDTDNKRIVMFHRADGAFYKIIDKPESTLFGSGESDYTPIACAVDQYGRIFVISSRCNKGVIVLADENGEFTGFIGAQKVTYSLIDIFWRRFQSEEERKSQLQYVPTIFNNITVDADGFIYITNDDIDESKQIAALTSKNADYSPVKKLNAGGNEIMKRNGFFDCGGEVVVTLGAGDPSKIVDVALGPEGSWSIIDSSRGRVYTYDSNGELLFAFGDTGIMVGTYAEGGLRGITYQGSKMLLLDDKTCTITVYERTPYGDVLIEALSMENDREYATAESFWKEILQSNKNFDAAYIGVGKALYRQGKYEEAMEYLRSAHETSYYSNAYAQLRKQWISKYFLLLILVVVVLLVALVKILGLAKKLNNKTALKVGKKTYWEELVFSFHLCFHPFDGFWDLKHEKRGSLRAGMTIVGLTAIAFYYQAVGKGYIFQPYEGLSNILIQLVSVLVPVLLWTTANWCLTTLFDGEGSFKDVLMAVCYSLAPLPPLVIVSTLLTNFLTLEEGAIATMIASIAYIWVGILIFFGMLVTHDYSLPKNIITTIGTILCMAVIIFVIVLFSSLIGKMIQFVSSIFEEIGYRV